MIEKVPGSMLVKICLLDDTSIETKMDQIKLNVEMPSDTVGTFGPLSTFYAKFKLTGLQITTV